VLTLAECDVRYFAELRAREFSRLDEHGLAYLDYTGTALYGTSQIRAHHQLLERGLFGNPHSEHSASLASTEAIERAREDILGFFGVTSTTHAVCFTANATAAIGLVASGYPFSYRHGLVLSADNHNSVNGIREYATCAGARVGTSRSIASCGSMTRRLG
jgi:selenocysteine lyase/cysteine desulfurase